MQELSRGFSAWPGRLAWATVLCAIPLVLFGGSVTTLEAGMAVEGWLDAEGHFLLFFPWEKWTRDPETFVEHTHRLFGTLVGLGAIATLVATWRLDGRPRAKAFAAMALLLVCAQGTLGGFRVLENSPRLAFLHGAFAQAVCAWLAGTALLLSRRFRAWEPRRDARPKEARPPVLLARLACLAVFLQIAVGAWYRHGLRPERALDSETRFMLHVVGAVGVLVLAFFLVARLFQADGEEGGPLARTGRCLAWVLGAQLLVGLCAWASYETPDALAAELVFGLLHVLGGATLLSALFIAALVTQRASEADRSLPERAAAPLGGTA